VGVPTIANVKHVDLEIERIARMEPELQVVFLLAWIDGGEERNQRDLVLVICVHFRLRFVSPRDNDCVWKLIGIRDPNAG
jgi:hypothetical protein